LFSGDGFFPLNVEKAGIEAEFSGSTSSTIKDYNNNNSMLEKMYIKIIKTQRVKCTYILTYQHNDFCFQEMGFLLNVGESCGIEAEFWKHIEHHQRLQQQQQHVGKDAL
jgi:hypothetical protein